MTAPARLPEQAARREGVVEAIGNPETRAMAVRVERGDVVVPAVAVDPAATRNGDAQSRPAASGAVWRIGLAYMRSVIKDASSPHSIPTPPVTP